VHYTGYYVVNDFIIPIIYTVLPLCTLNELLCILIVSKLNNRSTIQNEWHNKVINMHNNSYDEHN
jgi:hypothetical protein